MDSKQLEYNEIVELLKPETSLEERIIADPEFIIGVNYGEPRKGHPEGKVVYHISEVSKNIEVYHGVNNISKLRLIALVHDSFKYKVDFSKPKTGENEHGMIARRFCEEFRLDDDILEVVELHDEAYRCWKYGNKTKNWNGAKEKACKLMDRLGDNLGLYLTFYKCDNLTGTKTRDNFDWFLNLV